MGPYEFMNKNIAQALYRALTEDPFYISLEKSHPHDPETAKDAMLQYYDYAMKEALSHGKLVVTPDGTSGAGIWSLPPANYQDRELAQKQGEQKKNFIKTQMGQNCLDTYNKIVAFMEEASKDVVSDQFWYLSILGIDPESQGAGLGRALMKPVLKKTDELQARVYIESFTPKNFGFYRGLGFAEAKTIEEPLTGSQYAIMIRSPKKIKQEPRKSHENQRFSGQQHPY